MALRFQLVDTGEQLPLFMIPTPVSNNNSTKTMKLADAAHIFCPVCGAETVQENLKTICRSRVCTYRIVFNCSDC